MATARDSIEDFAALVAALDAPFADRDAVLASHSLTEQTFDVLTDAWRQRIAGDLESLEPRFARAYRAARNGSRPAAPAPAKARVTEQMPAVSGALAGPLPFAMPRSPADGAPSGPLVATVVGSGNTVPLAHTGTDAPLPFASSRPEVALTLEEYAEFRARLGVTPEQRDQLYRRYRIPDEPAQRQLDEAWRRRFATDRDTQKRFLVLAAQHRDALLPKKERT